MGRSPCCDKNGLKKGPWTPEEDEKLIDYIQKHGYGNWRTLPKNAGLQRCGKSCRLRWTNYLRPDIKRGRFSFEEEETIIQLHSVLGNKWSAIAARLPGRTDNEIKNYWNTHIRKRLLRMGIDPVTHSPRLDLLDLSSILTSSLYNNSSHHHHHQINHMSRLLGVPQIQLNPQLLRLATSLLSSTHQRQNQNFSNFHDGTGQQNQLLNQYHEPLANQFHQTQVQDLAPPTTLACGPFSDMSHHQQVVDPTNNVEQYDQSKLGSFISQDSQWQRSTAQQQEYYAPLQSYGNFYDQVTFSDPNSFDQTTTSTLVSDNSNNNNNHNFSFASVLSTPSSSPTPLNSNSTTYINGNTSTTTEDERESYSSSLLRFEIPADILDVSNFM